MRASFACMTTSLYLLSIPAYETHRWKVELGPSYKGVCVLCAYGINHSAEALHCRLVVQNRAVVPSGLCSSICLTTRENHGKP